MLARLRWTDAVRTALRRSPVVALVGPRQSGKTTLARALLPPHTPGYFDLENPLSLRRLDQPMTALESLRGLVVIDEIQRRPELFPVLRVLADRRPIRARFLILGSAAPELLRQSSETLAGRLTVLPLTGFDLHEVGPKALDRHWRRGGFPASFLAPSDAASHAWRQQFVQTYLERDLPSLGLRIPAPTLLRFWTMLAHYHGGLWNAAEAARSLGTSEPTARRYLDLLESLYLVRQLTPWHANIQKRQVKACKVYIRDSGLLHALLGLATESDLLSHPKVGASWEGYAIEETLRCVRPDAAHFWATHNGAELDLLLFVHGHRYGVEVKRQDAPGFTPSMRAALHDLDLRHLTVLYPGEGTYRLAPRVTVAPLALLHKAGPAHVLRPS